MEIIETPGQVYIFYCQVYIFYTLPLQEEVIRCKQEQGCFSTSRCVEGEKHWLWRCWQVIRTSGDVGRLWRVLATRPVLGIFMTTRTLLGKFITRPIFSRCFDSFYGPFYGWKYTFSLVLKYFVNARPIQHRYQLEITKFVRNAKNIKLCSRSCTFPQSMILFKHVFCIKFLGKNDVLVLFARLIFMPNRKESSCLHFQKRCVSRI